MRPGSHSTGNLFFLRRLFVAVAIALGFVIIGETSRADPEDLVVVVNDKNGESPDLASAKRLFVGETAFWPGNVAVHLFIRPPDTPASDVFYRALKMAPTRFRRLWQEKQLSGQGNPPETIADIPALIGKIASDPGAIGYALAQDFPAPPAGVRVVIIH